MTLNESIERAIIKKLRLKETILELIPRTGQYPYILMALAREKLLYKISWENMQDVFDLLYKEGKITEQQDFSRSIIKRAYRIR